MHEKMDRPLHEVTPREPAARVCLHDGCSRLRCPWNWRTGLESRDVPRRMCCGEDLWWRLPALGCVREHHLLCWLVV